MSDAADRDPGRSPRFVVPPGSRGGFVPGCIVLAAGFAIVYYAVHALVETWGLRVDGDAPGPGILLVGIAVVAVGLGLLSWGIEPRVHRLRRRVRSRWGLDVPGTDYPWDLRGACHRRWRKGLTGTFGILATGVVLLGLAWFAFSVSGVDGAWVFVGLSSILVVGVLALSVRALRPLGDALKWGTSRLLFERFPFPLGGTVDVRLPDVDALRGFSELTVTLRCVREEITLFGEFEELNAAVLRESVLKLTPEEVPAGDGDPAAVFALIRRVDPRRFLVLTFPLPHEDLGTVFTDRFARYWELEVRADSPGLPFVATFLLPVYAPVPPC